MAHETRHGSAWRRALLWIVASVGLGLAMPTPAVARPHDHGHTTIARSAKKVKYHCPMHPEVTAAKPGKCPKCGMALEPVKEKK